MQTPVQKSAPHPMMLIAAVAVVLFCGVGTAAVMGWLPTSSAGAASGSAAPVMASNLPATTAGAAAMPPAGAPGAPAAAYPAPPQGDPALTQNPPASQNPPPPMQTAEVCHSCGTVQSIREITTRAQGSGVGAAGGALLGGLLGNQVGSGHGRQLATVAGAIGGAVAGNQVEGNMNAHHSYEIVVRMEDGKHRTLHQSAAPAVREGDAVRVVNGQLRANG